ncbi:hypothetical protein RCL1_003223 [Eukaryota sp. TZLM3-RCL]
MFNSSHFDKRKLIGRGNFGAVYLVHHKSSGKRLVLKQVTNISPKERQQAENEVRVLQLLVHPNIISYHGSFIEEGQFNIIMDYADGGDLHSKLRSREGKLFSESEIMLWFVQILSALKHVHNNNILHRDLKTQNIFLTSTNIIKLGDFGISKQLGTHNEFARTSVGTPYYLSPEMCEDKPYNNKSDVWALGCCLYELATLRFPFQARSIPALVMSILRGIYEPLPSQFSDNLTRLIGSMLQTEPTNRPSVHELSRDPYVREWTEKFLQHHGQEINIVSSPLVSPMVLPEVRAVPVKVPAVFQDGKGMDTWKKEKAQQFSELESLLNANKKQSGVDPNPKPMLSKFSAPFQQPVQQVNPLNQEKIEVPAVPELRQRQDKPQVSVKKESRSVFKGKMTPAQAKEAAVIKQELREKRRHKSDSSQDLKNHQKEYMSKLKNVRSKLSKPTAAMNSTQDSVVRVPAEKPSQRRPSPQVKAVGSDETVTVAPAKPPAADSGLRDFLRQKKKEMAKKQQNDVDISILVPEVPPVLYTSSQVAPDDNSITDNVPVLILTKERPSIEEHEVLESSTSSVSTSRTDDNSSCYEELTDDQMSSFDLSQCQRISSRSFLADVNDQDENDELIDHLIDDDFELEAPSISQPVLSPTHDPAPHCTPLFHTELLLSPPRTETQSFSSNSHSDLRDSEEMTEVAASMRTMLCDQTIAESVLESKSLEETSASLLAMIEDLRYFCEKQIGVEAFKKVYEVLRSSEVLDDDSSSIIEGILGERVFILGCLQRILTLEAKVTCS